MLIEQVKRVYNANKDVPNTPPSKEQDCSDVLDISIFFDGTGNNKDADEEKKKWSNAARLWRNVSQFEVDTRTRSEGRISNVKAIYVSGVGTRFNKELGIFQRAVSATFQDHFVGKGVGTGGARRLEYGEEELNKSLENALKIDADRLRLDLHQYQEKGKDDALAQLIKKLGQHNYIKKINLSIFGFSRGAALGRAFANRMLERCKNTKDGLTYNDIPIEFKFLGLFDTVASFGLPATNLNNNLTYIQRDMVIDDRVTMCVHYVAANELRFCFPVDLIRKNGKLPQPHYKELVYPGMHSDVGGGYAPGSQGVFDNYARIPLRDMLQEAVTAGVKMYGYDELKEQHPRIFEQQFEVNVDTQKAFEAVMKAGKSEGKIEDQVQKFMALYYSAYATADRKGIDSVSKRERRGIWANLRRILIFGPVDMAGEMRRLKAVRGDKQKHPNVFKIQSPVSSLYNWIMFAPEWIFESWEKDTSEEIMQFYLNYVHDSKYGFMCNAEPFSYFRQRTIYESRRSIHGKQSDEQRAKEKKEHDQEKVLATTQHNDDVPDTPVAVMNEQQQGNAPHMQQVSTINQQEFAQDLQEQMRLQQAS